MNRRNSPVSGKTLAIVLAMAVTLCIYDAEPPQQVASVGPLLDSMASICKEAFDAKRHRLTLDAKDNVTGCEVKP